MPSMPTTYSTLGTDMNIVATSAEPEFVQFNIETDGEHQPIGGILNIDIANIEFAGAKCVRHGRDAGNVQVILVRSDVNTVIDSLVRAGLVERVNNEAEDADYTAL